MDIVNRDNPLSWISVSGVASLGIAYALQLLSKHTERRASHLDTATSIDCLEDLKKLESVLPLLVAVRGLVYSADAKRCELSDKHAVFREVVEEEIYRKETASGRVVQEPFEVRRVVERCDWYLEDLSQRRLRVDNAGDAAGLRDCLETKQVFVPEETTRTTLLQAVLDRAIKSMIKYGVRKTERYLPVGSVVTVVGELWADPLRAGAAGRAPPAGAPAAPAAGGSSAARDVALPAAAAAGADLLRAGSSVGSSGGTWAGAHSGGGGVLPYVMRKPANAPYFITPHTLQQLRASMANTSRTLKYVAWGFGALGAILVARKIVVQALALHQRRRVRRMLEQAEEARKQRAQQRAAAAAEGGGAAAAGAPAGGGEGGAGDGGDRAPNTCVVCLDRDVDIVFTGCGHMCVCYLCGHQLNKCPICRHSSKPIRVFKP